MGASFGERYKVTVFGQSHSQVMGAVIDGIPAGTVIDTEALARFMARRAPGSGPLSTPRRESDLPEIVSGTADGVCCGAPLCIIIKNTDARSADYERIRSVPRPSHADYPAYVKYGGHNDIRGGGQFSGRLTAPFCAAGGIALQLLEKRGIRVFSHILSVGGIKDEPFDPVSPDTERLGALAGLRLAVLDPAAGERMAAEIKAAHADGDSVGGIVECMVTGLPAGVGEPIYDSLESRIASLVFSIPAVKGVEFGSGFAGSALRGSRNNDPYRVLDGRIVTSSNNSGGICGGISTGMPVLFRAAFKPTPSISRPQDSVLLEEMKDETLEITGRHDPCIVPRALPAVEAAAAMALLDLMI